MTKNPSIFEYFIDQNCIVYKFPNYLLIYRGVILTNISYYREINKKLQEISQKKINSIIYISPLKKQTTLWFHSRNFDLSDFNSIVNNLCLKYSNYIKEIPDDSIVDEFFIHPYIQNENFIILDDKSNGKFEIKANLQKSVFLYKIILENKRNQIENNQFLQEFFDYLIIARIPGIIQLKIPENLFHKVCIIIFLEKLESKIAFEGYLKSLQILSMIKFEKIKIQDFRRILQKKIIKPHYQMNFNDFYNKFFRNLEKNKQITQLENNSVKLLEKLDLENSGLYKLSTNIYRNEINQFLFLLTIETFPNLVFILKNYYRSCKSLFIISSNLELIKLIKNRSNIEKLPKISFFFIQNPKKFLENCLNYEKPISSKSLHLSN